MLSTAALRLVPLFALFAGALSYPSLVRADPAVFEKDFVEIQTPEGVKVDKVSIDNRLGNVSVQGHDHPYISIQSFKRADDTQALERLVVSLIPDASGHVRVSTALRAGEELRPLRKGSVSVDLLVYVPRTAEIHAQLWKGELQVSKVDNGANLKVDKGSIDVKQVSGRVVSHMRRGDQAFSQLFGDLQAQGIEGELGMHDIQAKQLHASLVRGKITGRNLKSKDLQLRNVFGDIDLEARFTPGGKYLVVSRKGKVTVAFRGDTLVAMTVVSPEASIDSALAPKRLGTSLWEAHFGMQKGQAKGRVRPAHLEIRSSSGSVALKHF